MPPARSTFRSDRRIHCPAGGCCPAFTSRVGPIRAEPYFTLQYVYLDEDGYQEEGAGPIGMLVDDRTTNALFSDLGARFIKPIFLEQEWILTPEIVLGWVHDYDIDDRVIRAGFIGAPGTGFTVSAYQGNSHGFRAGAAFRVVSNGPVEASLEFDSRLRSHGYEMAGFLEFSVRF